MLQEIRQAVRALAARPSLVIVSVLTLAIGIGGNTAMFTVVDAVLLRPLPFHQPDRLMSLSERHPNLPTLSVSWQNYRDWHDSATSFTAVGAYRPVNFTLTGGSEPERVPGKMVTANMLPMLGVQPALGRDFREDEDQAGGAPVVLISDGLWRRRFAGAREIVGRTLVVDNTPRTIAGVLPAGFQLVQSADVLVPIGPWAATLPDDRGWHPGIFPLARLKAGVSIDKARAEMDAIARGLEQQYPETNLKVGAKVTPLQQQVVQNVRPALAVLLGAVGLVLLIACANVANLLLVRTVDRRREIAVRAALGASRWRLVRHILAESLVLSLAGGLLGVLLAAWLVSALVALAGPALPRAESVSIDERVLLFSLALSILTTLIFGAAPALQASRPDPREALTEESRASSSRGSRRLTRAFVVAEVALATTLLVGAGLLLQSFVRLQRVSPGFAPARLLVADLPLSPVAYPGDEERLAFVERLLEKTRALPGAEAAGTTTTLPMAGSGATLHFNIFGRPPKGPEDYVLAGYRAVSPGYLDTLGVPTFQGRLFDERDRAGTNLVVVINETMAQTFFAGESPIGRRLSVGTEPDEASPWMEVVGVIGDVRQSFEADAKAEMYVPYLQGAPDPVLAGLFRNLSVVLRTTGDPMRVAADLRRAVAAVDRDQPVVKVRTMNDAIGATVSQQRFRTTLVALFAAIALVLAAIGVYGVMAYGVSQRTHELGVRMALGAGEQQVVRLVLLEALALTGAGMAAGLAGGFAVSRLIDGLLFNTGAVDTVTFVVVPLLLGASTMLAGYLPARRALRVQPAMALR